jgi:hypothetical protein
MLENEGALQVVQTGVFECRRGTDVIRIIVAGQVPHAEHNAMLHLFSASDDGVDYGTSHYRQRSAETSMLLEQLLAGYRGEGLAMSYTMEDFKRDYLKENLKELTPEERLEGLSPEKRLEGVPPEKRLEGLSPEERLQGVPPKKRLEGLSAEERLEGLPPEKRLEGLSPEEIESLLKKLKAQRKSPLRKTRREKTT